MNLFSGIPRPPAAENHSAGESNRSSGGRLRRRARRLWFSSVYGTTKEEAGMRRSRQGGFTLIELMITVAIVGILAAVAYPSYTSYIRKGVRKGAQAQMLDIANREQQFLLANRAYADYTAMTGSGYQLPAELSGKYTPTIMLGTGTVPAFTVTFTAIGGQSVDGDLTFNSEGVKSPADKW
jgi:type IV pilus assembly protein PilE